MGVTIVGPPRQEIVVVVWTQGLATSHERACSPQTLRNFVDVRRCDLMHGPVSHISKFETRVFSEAMLDRDIPLQGIRSSCRRILAARR